LATLVVVFLTVPVEVLDELEGLGDGLG